MNELKRIVNTYFNKNTEASVYNNGVTDGVQINNIIQNMIQFEKPDIISEYDKKIIGIEHFEFDSYKNNKKGSDYKIKEYEIEKKFSAFMRRELPKRKNVSLTNILKSSSTLENYYTNFTTHFLNHYNKIDEYKNNIKSKINIKDKELEMWFFVEDVSPLGSYFMNKKREINLLHPFYNIDIIKLLENSPKVKGIILGTYAMKEYKVIFIYNNDKNIENLKKNIVDITENNFLSFEPHTTGFATLIPKQDK